VVLNHIFKSTSLQSTFGVIMLAIVNKRPRILSLREMIQHYVAHRREVVLRRTRFRLRKAKERAHILEGYRIALDNIDEVITIIRGSAGATEARVSLCARFGLSEAQAQAILDLRLQRLTGMERQKIEDEYAELLQLIEELSAADLPDLEVSVVASGLVSASSPALQAIDTTDGKHAAGTEPRYALQVMPEVEELRGSSVKTLAHAVVDHVVAPLDEMTGRWELHVVVPGQIRGHRKPYMRHRADLLEEAIDSRIARIRRRTHRRRDDRAAPLAALVQVALVEPERLFVSVSRCLAISPLGVWPCQHPAGIATFDEAPDAPASSYRKLAEAFAYMGVAPQPGETVVDLGASPGGWTWVASGFGARVTAVDRSPLDVRLMARPGVEFVRGDAFKFQPDAPVDWLVSDVVAYPERVIALIEQWCTRRAAR
ncbi:MAG: DNA gyrase subunit A, partial [Myxococcota bacterium]|nr:DNA gyrase subunit A [Myxococcota bacterium]